MADSWSLHKWKVAFETEFGSLPQFLVECPGRVNLIGEHVDYSGFGVFPMALDRCVSASARLRQDDLLRLYNYDSDRYSKFESVWKEVEIQKNSLKWYHYFLCGMKGVAEHLEKTCSTLSYGVDVLVKGWVPPNAGLSSSSALVCCGALCALTAFRHQNPALDIAFNELARICARTERYVGTEGGGMDQAICLLAEKGKALKIDFEPELRKTAVRLPSGIKIVVANSLVEKKKAADSSFNERVAETRMAAKVLAANCALDWRQVRTLADVQKKLGLSLAEMSVVAAVELEKAPYSREKVCQLLGISEEDLLRDCLSDSTRHMGEFDLFRRTLHTFTEARRVEEMARLCNLAESRPEQTEQCVLEMANLMNASHLSCSRLYECSHPRLDELASSCRSSGALGCRLTGAGWGGCTVSLVRAEDAVELIRRLEKSFYGRDVSCDVAFATDPGSCANVTDLR